MSINTVTEWVKVHPRAVFLGVWVVSLSIYLGHFAIAKNGGIWGDGRYYFAYTRSIAIDQDIDFANECQVDPYAFDCKMRTEMGKVFNKYAVGPGLLWLPWFLVAHLLVSIFRGTADGYHWLYPAFIGAGSVSYAVGGLYLMFRTVEEWVDRESALISAVFVWAGSLVLFYTAVDPVNSHSGQLLLSGLSFYCLSRWWNGKDLLWMGLSGVVIGLMGAVRPMDLLWMGVPLGLLIFYRPTLISILKQGSGLVLGAFVGLMPQLVAWKILYGRIVNPYSLLGEGFDFGQLKLWQVWFDIPRGLFVVSPLLLIATIGWFRLRHPLARIGLVLFGALSYLIASWGVWWGGEAYGGRMFLGLVPFWVWGLAVMLTEMKRRRRQVAVLAGLSLFVLMNVVGIVGYLWRH